MNFDLSTFNFEGIGLIVAFAVIGFGVYFFSKGF